MVEYVNIKDIVPAQYNPRKINTIQFEELKNSLKAIGTVIPIVVNKKNNVIVAGHQRTKALKAIEIERVPVVYVENITIGDEMKLNQLHNGVDIIIDDKMLCDCKDEKREEFIEMDSSKFSLAKVDAQVANETGRILMKYGNFLSCVVCKGEVITGKAYCKVCKQLGWKVNTYICSDEKYNDVKRYFTEKYGEFSYENLVKNTYVQGLAQLYRNPNESETKLKRQASHLYEDCVYEYLENNDVETILDFGCGKGDYIKKLAEKYEAIGVEFYNNNGKSINVSKGNKQIDELLEYLKKRKVFDVVVCDSVLNSVDCMEAEYAILGCLNALCSEKLFIAGRLVSKGNSDICSTSNKRSTVYLDNNNFTGLFRHGKWYYQHFHSEETIKQELEDYGFKVDYIRTYGSCWKCMCTKVRELPKEVIIKAIDYEFNLPLPSGRYNRHEEVKKALNLL